MSSHIASYAASASGGATTPDQEGAGFGDGELEALPDELETPGGVFILGAAGLVHPVTQVRHISPTATVKVPQRPNGRVDSIDDHASHSHLDRAESDAAPDIDIDVVQTEEDAEIDFFHT
jgi:hypothetical protein